MKSIPLTVLDQSPIRFGGTAYDAIAETLELASLCEKLGYQRFWVSEHHASEGLAGCSPEVLLARIGAVTSTIRIGSGGVMLPHYSPYKVAENFKLLEIMFPGRIDLGVGRAPGSDQYTAAALGYGSPVGAQYFPNKVADLQALLNDQPPPTPGMEQARACPPVTVVPDLWMLGSSDDSALLAASMGLPYSFAYFINANISDDIFRLYRQRFQAQSTGSQAYTNLGVFVICADTEEEAMRLSRSRDLWYIQFASNPKGPPIPTPEQAAEYPYNADQLAFISSNRKQMVVGTPEQVKEKLLALVQRFGADELNIVSITHDFSARCRSYELLADCWNS